MNLKATLKQPAPRDSSRFVSRYLDELLDYGGEPYTRGEIILDMQSQGMTEPEIARWLQGYELGCRARARHARQQTQIKLYVTEK